MTDWDRVLLQATVGTALALTVCADAALAQAWPARSVRVIVPFGAGGGTDIQGRLLSKKFFESMGQTFVIDNRAGAGGMIGAELAAKSPPDGYTLLFTTASLAVNVSLHQKAAFDPLKDLMPVSLVSSTPLILVTHPSVPVKSVKELIALAKARKGGMNAASNGSGTTSHLTIEMLKQATGIEVTHIPYKGGGPATTATLSGEVDFLFTTVLSAYPQVKAGKLRALAVTTAKRSRVAPELPTMSETIRDFESDNWYAFFVPAGTSKEIIVKLNSEIVKALKAPDVVDFMLKDGADPVGSPPGVLATSFAREIEKYAKLVKSANIKVE